MAWYRTGLLQLRSASADVTGVGTDFIRNVNPGDALVLESGAILEIERIISATQLVLVTAWAGADVDTPFQAMPTRGYIRDLALNSAALVQSYADAMDVINSVDETYLPLTGGSISGPLEVAGTVTASPGLLTVSGNLYLPAGASDSGALIGLPSGDGFNTHGVHMPHYGIKWASVDDSPNGASLFQSGYGGVRFFTAGVERARIDAAGNVLVGKPADDLFTAGSRMAGSTIVVSAREGNTFHVFNINLPGWAFYVRNDGQIFSTSTSIASLSDGSLKKNVRELETGIEAVMALKPRRFDWVDGSKADVSGFVAQEVQAVLPELIEEYDYQPLQGPTAPGGLPPGSKLSIRMSDMIPTLVRAIQQQQELIETLTARVAALEAPQETTS